MKSEIADTSTIRASWLETLIATAPFAILSISLICNGLPPELNLPSWLYYLGTYILVGNLIILPIGLFIGWTRNFPRWSYPYIGLMLLFSLYMMEVAFPNLIFGERPLGWAAWLPFLIVILAALAVSRSIEPLKKFFTNAKKDWTLLTFSMFGLMPMLIAAMFDGIEKRFSIFFMLILVILVVGIVILYMRCSSVTAHENIMIFGIFLMLLIAVMGRAWYWFGRSGSVPWSVFIMGLVVYLVTLSPALFSLLRKKGHTA